MHHTSTVMQYRGCIFCGGVFDDVDFVFNFWARQRNTMNNLTNMTE